MNGNQRILEMRRRGFKPEFVWVSDFHGTVAEYRDDALVVRVNGATPELEDFRFLVGLTVIVEGRDQERVRRLATACAAHARRVIANTMDDQNEVVSITDTEGALTWPT